MQLINDLKNPDLFYVNPLTSIGANMHQTTLDPKLRYISKNIRDFIYLFIYLVGINSGVK